MQRANVVKRKIVGSSVGKKVLGGKTFEKKGVVKKGVGEKIVLGEGFVRQKTFVTSFLKNTIVTKKRMTRIANQERLGVIKQLAMLNKRVVVVVPSDLMVSERTLQGLKKLGRNVRVMRVGEHSVYNTVWQRDAFTRLKRRYFNKEFAQGSRTRIPQHAQRYFGEGGRVVQLGEKTLLVSKSLKESAVKSVQKEIAEEMSMLKRQGYNVFELPGHSFSPYGQKGKPLLKKRFFDHIDVFVNTIPEKKLLLVDPDYLKKNVSVISSISRETGYKVISVPEKEKYYYPANLLSLGKGEVIVNSAAKETIRLLKKNGVKVYATPKDVKFNLTMSGSIGCFVNVD